MKALRWGPGKRARLSGLERLLETARAEGVAPGLSAVVCHRGEVVHASFHGEAQVEPASARRPLGERDLFDVGSITKVAATTTLAALLVEDGSLRLDDPVARYLPTWGRADPQRWTVTVRHLLCHSSGLPAYREYFREVARSTVAGLAFLPPAERPSPASLPPAFEQGLHLVRRAAMAEPLEAPPGTRAVYSDIGFLLLGWVLEVAGGGELDALCEERIFDPLGLRDTFFLSGLEPARSEERRRSRAFVATERCEHRSEVNCGFVNDDNAYAMGGVAGHAGLFSTGADLAELGTAWLDAVHGRSSLLGPEVAARFAKRDPVPGSSRAVGWDGRSAEGSSLGAKLGDGPLGAIGHLGWTGTSLWIDLDRELICVLLTNRCHPDRANEEIKRFRPRFHDQVAGELGL